MSKAKESGFGFILSIICGAFMHGILQPLLLSQILAVVGGFIAVWYVIKHLPAKMFICGFVAGSILVITFLK